MKYSDLKKNMTVFLDDGFTCHKAGPVHVKEDLIDGFYFTCKDGRHYFDGQIDCETDKLIGVSTTEHNHSVMKQFVGTKVITARQMTRQEYNNYRGWELPSDEDGSDKGWLVEYPYDDTVVSNHENHAGYISWSPDTVFQAAYKASGQMNFGHALEILKAGGRVSRSGWNGKNMFIFLVNGSTFTVNREPLLSILGEGTQVNYHGHVDMKTADGTIVPWLCSQTDMQAHDWGIVPDA